MKNRSNWKKYNSIYKQNTLPINLDDDNDDDNVC